MKKYFPSFGEFLKESNYDNFPFIDETINLTDKNGALSRWNANTCTKVDIQNFADAIKGNLETEDEMTIQNNFQKKDQMFLAEFSFKLKGKTYAISIPWSDSAKAKKIGIPEEFVKSKTIEQIPCVLSQTKQLGEYANISNNKPDPNFAKIITFEEALTIDNTPFDKMNNLSA